LNLGRCIVLKVSKKRATEKGKKLSGQKARGVSENKNNRTETGLRKSLG